MERRQFLKICMGAGASGLLPLPRFAFAQTAPPLPIPPLLLPDETGTFTLRLQIGHTLWRTKATPTWGINGPLLGPALSLRRGQPVRMRVENALPEDTALHWHGLEIPGESDGGPQAVIAKGGVWEPSLSTDQPAATCWYHPHPHRVSGRHVAMGLGGLIVLNDEESDRLPLPRRWGIDDIPVILQDKRLNKADEIDYELDVVSAAVGWFGTMMLTNGSLYPSHSSPRGWVRLRLLNACNARSLCLAFHDRRSFYVIAGDGGFLAEPVRLETLFIHPGERFEVLVDLGDGKRCDLETLPVAQMGMRLPPFDVALPVLRLNPGDQDGHRVLPEQLVAQPPLPALNDLPVRTLALSMDPRLDHEGMAELMHRYGPQAMDGIDVETMNHHGGMEMEVAPVSVTIPPHGHGNAKDGGIPSPSPSLPQDFDLMNGNFINGRAFRMDEPAFDVKLGVYERWVISGEGDMMSHPFHIHGVQFRILSENDAPPPAHRQGFKDTVFVEGKKSEVLVRFTRPAPKERAFMAHCHLLEHEDTGMMTSFTVTP